LKYPPCHLNPRFDQKLFSLYTVLRNSFFLWFFRFPFCFFTDGASLHGQAWLFSRDLSPGFNSPPPPSDRRGFRSRQFFSLRPPNAVLSHCITKGRFVHYTFVVPSSRCRVPSGEALSRTFGLIPVLFSSFNGSPPTLRECIGDAPHSAPAPQAATT